MSLWRTIGIRRLHARPLRTSLVVVGVALGVAIFVAFNLLRVGIDRSFRRSIDAVAGKTQLEVTAGPTGVPVEIAEQVKRVPGVAHAAPVLEMTVPIADGSTEGEGDSLLIVGVDMLGDDFFRRDLVGQALRLDDPLELVRSSNVILVGQRFAARRGLTRGASFEVATSAGVRRLRIGGILPDGDGLARAYGGQVGVMDLLAAGVTFGRRGRADRVQIALAPGETDLARSAERVRGALGGKFEVEPPARRGERTERLLFGFENGLLFASVLALLAGMLLVYNAVAIAVAERRQEIGTLRALGASRRTIAALVLAEAAMLGLAGSALGGALGVALAGALSPHVGETVSSLYVRLKLGDLAADPTVLAAAGIMGTASSVGAAVLPAWAAAGIAPSEAIRRRPPRFSPVSERLLTVVGVALLAVAAALVWVPAVGGRSFGGQAAAALVVLGSPLLVPAILRALTPALRMALAIAGAPGRLAVDNLTRLSGRTVVTISTLGVAVALTICVGGFAKTVHQTLVGWIDQTIPADVLVSASSLFVGPHSTPLPPELGAELAKIPGVEAVDTMRNVRADISGEQGYVLSADTQLYERYGRLRYTEGDRASAAAAMLQGEVTISDNLARRRGLHVGDSVRLTTPEGARDLRIAGVYVDYSSDRGLVRMDRSLYRALFADPLVDMFELYLAPGRGADEVRAEILKRSGRAYDLRVHTHRAMRERLVETAGQVFDALGALEAVAILIAVLGVVNTLSAAVLDRTRELGILRAIGATRGQVRRALLLEAALLGVAAAVLGIPCGLLLEVILVTRVNLQATGWAFPWIVPVGTMATAAIGVTIAATLAGLWPAHRASRLTPVDALRAE